jgi:hypothetical protein
MKRLLTILLLAAATAHGQIDNPPTSVNIVDSTATGRAVLTATNAAAAATAIGLGTTNDVTFNRVATTASGSFTNPAIRIGASNTGLISVAGFLYGVSKGESVFAAGPTGFSVVPPATFSTNVNVNGSLVGTGPATFSTNVSVAGSLTVGSFTTTTPSTWALDAVQTNSSGATSFLLTLPDNGNVIRVTNASVIRNIANGRLGAFYYLVNQSGGSFAIDNTNGITVQGGKSLTLANNEVATLVATGPTNVSVAGRGDLTDVALGGTANTAPSQTASSGSSLMTRNLYDERLPLAFGLMDAPQADFGTVTLANGASGSKAAGGFELTTGSSNNATAVWNASSSATFGRKHTAGIGGVSTVWTGRVMVGWWFVRALSTNSEIRLQYGRTYNATTHAALSARGVGVRIATNSVFFETHNGTTGFETTNVVTVTNPMFYWAIVETGVAKFYAGQTLVATVTNSVPTNNSTDNDFGWVMSISNTSTNSSIMRAFANPGFVMQQ